jgi:hypothetical protein
MADETDEIDRLSVQAFCEQWDRWERSLRSKKRLQLSAADLKARHRRQRHWRDLRNDHDWFRERLSWVDLGRVGAALRDGHIRPAQLHEAKLTFEEDERARARAHQEELRLAQEDLRLWQLATGERRDWLSRAEWLGLQCWKWEVNGERQAQLDRWPDEPLRSWICAFGHKPSACVDFLDAGELVDSEGNPVKKAVAWGSRLRRQFGVENAFDGGGDHYTAAAELWRLRKDVSRDPSFLHAN